MYTIEFLVDHVLRDEHEGTPAETRYTKGQRLKVNAASAKHWIDRRLARIVPTHVAKKAKPKATSPKPAPEKASTTGTG